jgi:hypothetical protein
MGVVVQFNYQTWAAQFPTLAPYVAQDPATGCFNTATLYFDNTGCGPVNDPVQAANLLNLLTAHIAVLTLPTTGPVPGGPVAPDPPSPVVGRIDAATEGTVNFHAVNDYPAGSPQWYQQTTWGSLYWEATSQFRTMHYIPTRRASGPFGPFGFVRGWGYGGGPGFRGGFNNR